MAGLIGKKVGMTRIFDDEGVQVPVTVIEAGPCPPNRLLTWAVAVPEETTAHVQRMIANIPVFIEGFFNRP